MSSEHIRFITVGFAELLAALPDPATASDPSLQDYWPDTPWTLDDAPENTDDAYRDDVCDTCHVHEGHEPSCPNNRDNENTY